MKKYIVFFLLLSIGRLSAQEPLPLPQERTHSIGFHAGENCLQAGLGYPNRLASYEQSATPYAKTFQSDLVYFISYERGVSDNISVGGCFGYGSAFFHRGAMYSDYTISATLMSLRAAYHFTPNNPLDLYAGGMAGLGKFSEGQSGIFTYAFPAFIYDIHVGGKYYFNEGVGIFGEAGFGLAYLNGGISFKF